MLESLKEGLLFEPLTEEEKQKRGILGRLYGPIASFKMGTRNGRFYNEELWEKVFQNNLVKELLESGGIPGELSHPVDREETDPEKVAVMMPEAPKRDKQGHLVGYFDIVDTPCGRIAAALAKYGFKFGVSSRGSGDTTTNEDGTESVDPNTYMLNAWDLVLIPACADARMTFVESYNPNSNKLSTELFNDINNASEEDRDIMVEALENLDIDYMPAWARNKGEKVLAEDIRNNQAKQLQDLLKENTQLKTQIKELNSKLSVGYAQEKQKEASLNEAVESARLIKEEKESIEEENNSLKEGFKALKDVQRKLTEQTREAVDTQKKLANTSRQLNEATATNNRLNEDIKSVKENLQIAQNTINTQRKKFEEQLNQKDARIDELQNTIKNDGQTYRDGILKAKELVEKYKKRGDTAVDRYIDIKAKMIGVNASQIKKQLGETYTFSDIDTVCESLVPSIRRSNSLPFNITSIATNVKPKTSNSNNNKDVDIFGFNEW